MQRHLTRGRDAAITPILFFVGFVCLILIWKLLKLPDASQLFERLVSLYDTYGLWIIAIGAFVEGLVLVNLYFPGSAVIVVGVAACKGNVSEVCALVCVVTGSFCIAAQVNYVIGYTSVHELIAKLGGRKWLLRSHARYEKYGVYVLPPSFVHPNIGAFMSVTCGVARLNIAKYAPISIVSIVFWNGLWGIMAYYFSKPMTTAATDPRIMLAVLGGWVLASFFIGCVREHVSPAQTTHVEKR